MVARITQSQGTQRSLTPGSTRQAGGPALDAMASFANVGPRGMKTNPGAVPPPEKGPFNATQVDSSKTDAIADEQNSQSQADRDLMTRVGLNTISGLQTRNAESAARMGLQAGGASYLSGQRSAAVAGVNAFNQGLQQWGQQRQGILQGQAGIAAGQANTNAGFQQGAQDKNTQYGIDKDKSQQDTKSAYYSNELAGIDARAQEQSNIFGDDKKGPLQQEYNDKKSAYNKAVSEGNWALADQLLAQLNSLVPARK